MASPQWTFEDDGQGGGKLIVGERAYPTNYSRRVVELIIERKGIERAPRYLSYKKERGGKLDALFGELSRQGRQVRVLEPGCSAGHLSEKILDYPCVTRLVSFDPDAGMVAVCRAKKEHFGLRRWEVSEAVEPGFTDEKFDVVIMSAMMEHVDPKYRDALVRGCYERLEPGGLFVVVESFNRAWPFEYHVIRLPIPYAHYLPPRWIYRLCRLSGRYDASWSYEEFANPNTGWWGTSYRELIPSGARVTDVSEQFGYGLNFYLNRWKPQGAKGRLKSLFAKAVTGFFRLFGVPRAAMLPALYVVFRKEAA
ncbi:MAG: class I SAM-dependent methyltransferase [Deltaproteobacteria bacterium]|nr:class I SAM-dependent methyltransferase [Deltaproteobacteria bacterium]